MKQIFIFLKYKRIKPKYRDNLEIKLPSLISSPKILVTLLFEK